MIYRNVIFCIVITSLVASRTAAQQGPGPLTTDRPDQTESSATVEPGFLQLESGMRFTRDSDAGVTAELVEAASSLLRIGILDRLEGRLGFGGWQRVEVEGPAGSQSLRGVADVEVGIKVRLLDGRGASPQTAVILASTLPTGHDAVGSERADPSVIATFAHTLSSRASLGYNAGLRWNTGRDPTGDLETAIDAVYTVVLGLGVAERVGVFLEAFGSIGVKDQPADQLALDGGFTFLARDNFQLDLSGGIGVAAAADDWFVGAGASLRVPR